MREFFAIVLAALVVALLLCARQARGMHKKISRIVVIMLLTLVPPIIGNMIIMASGNRMLSTVGYYIYFLGMDAVMLAALNFSVHYCDLQIPDRIKNLTLFVVGLDVVQILLNPFFTHAFTTEEITAYGFAYFRLVPYLGQTFHRIVDYGILGIILMLFIYKTRRANRFNTERYGVILAVIVITAVWESVYIFRRVPVDRSMIGFGVFGLLVYYFSLYYRPFRLLDRMLSTVASNIPDALYCYDISGQCIWVNRKGMELVQAENEDFDAVSEKLGELIGSIGKSDSDWAEQRVTGSGENVRSYVMEHRIVRDDKGTAVGYFLNIRDNTSEQKTLQREIYNATHDTLTQLYNRAGYDLLVKSLDLETVTMLLVDVDEFKGVNDKYGHKTGDRVLQKIARTMERFFRSEDYICRIGGDEFIVLMMGTDKSEYDKIRRRIKSINDLLADTSDGLPAISVSVGVACGDKTEDPDELFEQADRALYDTKANGRKGMTMFDEAASGTGEESDQAWKNAKTNGNTFH